MIGVALRRRQLRRAVVGGIAAWSASLAAAIAYLAPGGIQWARDVLPLAGWSVPLAGVVAAGAVALLPRSPPRNQGVRGTLALVLGAGLGLALFAVLAAWRRGWTFPVPLFTCWAYGGALGLLSAALPDDRAGRVPYLVMAAAASVLLLLSHGVLRRPG